VAVPFVQICLGGRAVVEGKWKFVGGQYKVGSCGACGSQLPEFTVMMQQPIKIVNRRHKCPHCRIVNLFNH
jgi:hypothetical protein